MKISMFFILVMGLAGCAFSWGGPNPYHPRHNVAAPVVLHSLTPRLALVDWTQAQCDAARQKRNLYLGFEIGALSLSTGGGIATAITKAVSDSTVGIAVISVAAAVFGTIAGALLVPLTDAQTDLANNCTAAPLPVPLPATTN